MKRISLVLAALGLLTFACGQDQRTSLIVVDDSGAASGGSGGAGADVPDEPVDPTYSGTVIPAMFEAESFVRAQENDMLQEGSADCASDVNEFVDIEAVPDASGGCSVGYANSGEWIEFDIAVTEDGAFDFTLSMASQFEGRSVSIAIDGVTRGTLTANPTDWYLFEDVTLAGIGIEEGEHVLRISFDTGAVNLDTITVTEAEACIPACANRECGDDFCGGVCGTCASDQTCNGEDRCIGPFLAPVAEHGHLSVVDGQMVNESGDPVQLRGVSTQWLNFDRQYAGNADGMESMRDDWGLEVYRIANGVELSNGYLDEDVRPERLAEVKQMIDDAIERDIYALVDWHTHEFHQTEAIGFFTEIARQYGDEPNIIYEVFNEPIGPNDDVEGFWADELKPYHEALVAAIRAEDPDNVIILGTPRWSQEVAVAAADPVAGNDLLYALHFYACTHSSWLRDRAQSALDLGAGLFVTEWGSTHADGGTASNPGVCTGETLLWHDFLDANHIGSAAWKLVSDADDSAIFFGATATGPWEDDDLTEHGRLVRDIIQRP